MAIKSMIKKYKDYESKELARRAAKRKRIAPYRTLKNKNIPVKKATRIKLTAKGITRAIDNPYGVEFPKARKVLTKIKKRKRKPARKIVVVYK